MLEPETFVLLEDLTRPVNTASARLYRKPIAHIICHRKARLLACLNALAQWQAKGYHLAGFISYEAAHALQTHWVPACTATAAAPQDAFPLLHFMVFSHYQFLTDQALQPYWAMWDRQAAKTGAYPTAPFLYDSCLNTAFPQYRRTLHAVHQAIRRGETYQVNVTAKYQFHYAGTPSGLYRALRPTQKAAYAALIQTPEYAVLSLSPECFFKKQGHRIMVKPMKGTMPRSDVPQQDQANKNFLKTDPKSLAENVMIVDLLRNDLARIALPGSICVPRLFEVETYRTVHQMTATIHAEVPRALSIMKLIQALFPCGSITGAPKYRTMEWIHRLESEPRRIYTGAIGYITPENAMCFNVAIRTLLLQQQRGELGVGGGIVADSCTKKEYQEMQLKARFLAHIVPPFSLVESVYYASHVGVLRFHDHVARLKKAAARVGFVFSYQKLKVTLDAFLVTLRSRHNPPLHAQGQQGYKVRLQLDGSGQFSYQATPLSTPMPTTKISPKMPVVRFALCPLPATVPPPEHVLWQLKTTSEDTRGLYQRLLCQAQSRIPAIDEVVCINRQGYLSEGTHTNLFVVKKGHWLTPARHCGVLPGVLRAAMMQQKGAREVCLTPDDLIQADAIYLSNAVRGLRRAYQIKQGGAENEGSGP